MADWTVRRHGTDSSGRGIYASDYMWTWWLRCCDELGFAPTIVQGAWMTMNGGGAAASAGYHDGGGCFDLRVWNLSSKQAHVVIRVLRSNGAAAWIRDSRHGGMDPHIHFVLGSDHDVDSGAAYQWRQYLAGRDGLASNGPDYHWRPDPLVTTPPREEFLNMNEKEAEALFRKVIREELRADRRRIRHILRALRAFAKQTGRRFPKAKGGK